ncbi:ParM/StbA family protein [Paenibacillus alvei]|uniref:ParM/StbA family protein n=1 Tax=Paenibacillus alvei TaxID=44250 RepID=UPI0022824787|nr:ParM/StbA family protein [Paenibacillus alvei]
MVRIVGADLGNDSTKPVFSAQQQFRLKNAVSRRMMTEIRKNLSLDSEQPDILDDLDVIIDSEKIKGRFFVGNLAAKVGEDIVKPGTRKVQNDSIIVPLITMLALNTDEGKKEEQFKVVCGLPIKEFSDDKDIFRNKIMGSYKVEFLSGRIKGRKVTIHIEDVAVLPEGVPVVMNRMLDDSATKFRDESLRSGQVGVIDIGAFTTDMPVIVNGKPDSDASDGLDEGIAIYLDRIVDYVNDRYEVKMTRAQLVERLEDNDFVVPIRGQEVDLEPFVNEQFIFFADKIVSIVDKLWERNYEIKRFYVVGGGAKALQKYLEEKMNERGISLTFIEDEDPQMQNALGYWKYGVTKFRKK